VCLSVYLGVSPCVCVGVYHSSSSFDYFAGEPQKKTESTRISQQKHVKNARTRNKWEHGRELLG